MRERAADLAFTARTLAAAGLGHPQRPDRLARAGLALARLGLTPAAGYAAAAAQTPDRPALDDERGRLSFADVHRRTNALARALRPRVAPGDRVAILARNHRGFVEATVACSKLGADAIFLNTSLAAPEIAAVLARDRPGLLIHDGEFADVARAAAPRLPKLVAWHADRDGPTLEALIAGARDRDLRPPPRRGRVVILTSGTTGPPRGARRREPDSLTPVAALLDAIPLRARETTLIAAPLFHAWGYAHLQLGLLLSSTLVLRRRFDAGDTRAALERTNATALVVVPVMLERLLAEPTAILRGRLRVVATSGSRLSPELAARALDAFGEVVYNLYGSTEVAWATIAGPADLRAAPGTAGRPPRGTTIRLYGDDGRPAASGVIHTGNALLFDGYAGESGRGKAIRDGLMSTGDLGHLDADGRLFVDGRDDEMIVTGGENVFPSAVEDLLAEHPEIVEAAVIGVPDAELGAGLEAFVVRAPASGLDEAAIQAYVRRHLAGFRVPRAVSFVAALPRNATGKVVKRALYP